MISRRSFLSKVATLTGSVAFGVATHNSDEDWLIDPIGMAALGIRADQTTDYEDAAYPDAGFRTYREGNINLIVAMTASFHDRWMEAHRHCMVERPKQRKRRVQVFRHYLYGEPLHG